MKTKEILIGILFCFFFANVSAQEKSIKANTNQKIAEDGRVASLLNSKTFEFIATTVYPLSGSPKNIAGSGYSVRFSPEMIISNLPFFGRAYSAAAMRKDRGMRFQGKPEIFKIEKNKEYQINTLLKDGDTYELSLSVSNSGYARLTINTNDRGTISYQGEIVNISE